MRAPAELTNAIRALAMDAVERANSGHPGMPMGMAEIAEALWNRQLRHNPANPQWVDRDRFVLSNGHGSMLLYALLHLTGYDLPMAELQRFRQLHAKTAGHPEVGVAPGVETTTGPLGQGLANAVGMALAERLLASAFNRPGHAIVDHFTYVFVGDGCLMEGLSHEACSLAGTLGLGKLIACYDDNGISIDGDVRGWFRDDTPRRFEAYGWHVIADIDGHDGAAVEAALQAAQAVSDRPSLLCCKTVIGKGAPNKQGSAETHGAVLGAAEIAATRTALGWNYPPFEIPEAVYAGWDQREKGAVREAAWRERYARYAQAHPELAREFDRRMSGTLPARGGHTQVARRCLPRSAAKAENSRHPQSLAERDRMRWRRSSFPSSFGGSADLTGGVFNLTLWPAARRSAVGHAGGGNIHLLRRARVRDGGDLERPRAARRLYPRNRHVSHVLGLFAQRAPDGRADEAAQHLRLHPRFHRARRRRADASGDRTRSLPALIPNMTVWRPCDTVETAVAWGAALTRTDGPTCLVLSRQNIDFQSRDDAQVAAIARGGYVLADSASAPRAVLIATGSEVPLAMAAREQLAASGIDVRVVSMPSTNVFDRQDGAYRAQVLPTGIPRVAVEAGVTDYWRKYVGLEGGVVGIDTYGESAPGERRSSSHFGFTAEHVA